jgi:hypothetical protein
MGLNAELFQCPSLIADNEIHKGKFIKYVNKLVSQREQEE